MLYDKKWDKPKQPDTELEPWRQSLLEAADILECKGWCQHQAYADNGRMCILGALARTAGEALAHKAVLSEMGRDHYQGHSIAPWNDASSPACRSIASWNDAPGRTKEEVVAMLRSAALR
jgi:hypothetical protein